MAGEKARTDGRQLRWERHNAQRRERILRAAVDVIAESAPGTEVHVQAIADRAGLSRTVVYRHFNDRGDLDRDVQSLVLQELWDELLPAVSLRDGTITSIIRRIVATYVGWTVAHPSLSRFVEIDTSRDGSGPLQRGLEITAGRVTDVIEVAIDLLDVELSDDERAALDPLVHGVVGAVFAAVRRWLVRPERQPDAAVLVDVVTDSVWHVLDGHTRRLGVPLDPDLPVEQLLGVSE